MKGRTHFAAARQIASLAIAVLLAAQACAQDTPPETGLPADSASGREQWVWLPTLAEGLEKAKATSAPILVRCGAEYCPWCRKFDEVIAQPAVQDELEHWVLVAIDVEKAPDDAAKLGVASIPALRIVSNGRMTATHNGYLDADVLVAWLQAHRQESSADASGGPADDSPPDESALGRLVADLAARDPARREAAIGRLLPHVALAAPAVAESFTSGSLQARLSAIELLTAWQAPVGSLDPWRPETIGPAELSAIAAWAAEQEQSALPPAEPAFDDKTRADPPPPGPEGDTSGDASGDSTRGGT